MSVPLSAPRALPVQSTLDLASICGLFAIAAVITWMPIALHLVHPFAGVAACVLLAFMLANYQPAAAPFVLVFAFFFQNIFVAVISPLIADLDQFNAIRGYNFAILAIVWMVTVASYWLDGRSRDRFVHLTVVLTTGVLAVIFPYFVLGVLSDGGSATVYLRNIAGPILTFQAILIIASRQRVPLAATLAPIAVAMLALGYTELIAQERWLSLINGEVYLTLRGAAEYESGSWHRLLQETGRVYRGVLDTLQSDFLNTPLLADLGIKTQRLVGPNFHSISYAYGIAVLGVVLMGAGYWWVLVVSLPLLFAIGSKGALVLVAGALITPIIVRICRGYLGLLGYGCLMVVYMAAGIFLGLQHGDYHVLGFIGGVYAVMRNPIGQGLGAGGNLGDVSVLDWSRAQALGFSESAAESAIGVLLFQMGIASLVILGVLLFVAVRLWSNHLASGRLLPAILAITLVTTCVNGIFQEEALFAPLALGLVLVAVGIFIGQESRDASARARALAWARSRRAEPSSTQER
jgi:hypothetical protein